MDRVTMTCVARVSHRLGVATDDSTQVAFAFALMSGYLEASIENFKAVNALAEFV